MRTAAAGVYAEPWPELIVLLIATLTRFWRLNYHSVWFDEAVSLAWAGADPSYTWQVTTRLVEEKHPPVYYVGLHYWQAFLEWFQQAQNDAALRAFGAVLGVLTILGILLLVRRLRAADRGARRPVPASQADPRRGAADRRPQRSPLDAPGARR